MKNMMQSPYELDSLVPVGRELRQQLNEAEFCAKQGRNWNVLSRSL